MNLLIQLFFCKRLLKLWFCEMLAAVNARLNPDRRQKIQFLGMGYEGDLYRTMQNGNLTICGLDAGSEGYPLKAGQLEYDDRYAKYPACP